MFSLDGVFSMCTCQSLGDRQGRLEAQPGRGQVQDMQGLRKHVKESGLGPVGNGGPWEGLQQWSKEMGFPSGWLLDGK